MAVLGPVGRSTMRADRWRVEEQASEASEICLEEVSRLGVVVARESWRGWRARSKGRRKL